VSEIIQLQSVGALRALRAKLEEYNPKGPINTIFLVSFDGLPVNFSDSRERDTFAHEFAAFCDKQGTQAFQISNFEYAFLASTDADNTKGTGTDLKIMLLGIIQNLYPDYFQETDQSRIVRKLPLPERLVGFQEYISKRHKEVLIDAGVIKPKHKLNEADITHLKSIFSEMSSEKIAGTYISRQSIYAAKKNEPVSPVAEEFFISIEAIRANVLPDTDFRGNGSLFNHLTLYLDKILLGSLHHVADRNLPISINLNVESVFSVEFKKFMGSFGKDNLKRIQIEFRQADILQNLRQYQLVGRILAEHQGSTVIDAVFPDTLGLVRMERLSPAFVKIFWQNDSDTPLHEHKQDVADIIEAGIFPVLSRVESEAGFQAGLDLGIKLFQGFYFDALAKKQQATAPASKKQG